MNGPQRARLSRLLGLALTMTLAACTSAAPAGSSNGAPSAGPSSAGGGGTPSAATSPAAPPSASGEVVNIKLVTYFEDKNDPNFTKAVAEWNAANPGIQVSYEPMPYDEYYGSGLTTMFASGAGPDLYSMSPASFMDYINNGLAAPLDDVLAPYLSDFRPFTIEAATVDGKIYAIPYEAEPVALFYNKKILSEAGVEAPTTWDELTAAAQATKTAKRSGFIFEPAPGAYQNFTWYPFLWSAGGEVVDADWAKSLMRTEEATKSLDLWGNFIKDGLSPSQLPTGTFDAATFGREETALQVLGSWAVGQMATDFPNVDYGVVPLPHPDGKESVSVVGGSRQMVNAKSAHLAEAKQFAAWLWIQNDWFAKGWACGWRTELPPRISIADACAGQGLWADPHLQYFVDTVLPLGRAEPRYPNQIVQPVSDAIQATMFGGKTGAEAGAEAADKIDQFLATYQGAH
jgi:multiple sugar transport system substrate-binding protein